MLGALVNDNRRSAYRVRPIETDRLRLILKWRDTRYEPFEVGDVTRHGASVRFPKGVGPGVRKGDEVAVEIESPNLHGGATIAARVVFSGDSTTERMLGLAFDDAEGLDARATESFFQLFNRRVVFPVTVRNLSATGICLDVGEEADRFMVERGDIRVSLTLPGMQLACDIITTVCYRSVIAGKIYYGCHFDWPATPRAQAILEALTNYTTERFEQEIASLSG